MQSLILKLQADVAARKRPRSDSWSSARMILLVSTLFLASYELGASSVDTSAGFLARAASRDRIQALQASNDALQGEVELQRTQIERLEEAYRLSAKYGIGADLAMSIHEIALAEGVEPEIAFEMVRVESNFVAKAVSPVGAVGYTQLMPSTAQFLAPGISRRDLFDRETNLRLGFRYFRALLDYYRGNVELALVAYNRGPMKVDRLLKSGIDPANGYAARVLGRKGK